MTPKSLCAWAPLFASQMRVCPADGAYASHGLVPLAQKGPLVAPIECMHTPNLTFRQVDLS